MLHIDDDQISIAVLQHLAHPLAMLLSISLNELLGWKQVQAVA